MKSNKLKLFIAIFFTALMIASVFGVLATNDNSSSNLNHETADATNIPTGCAASASVPTHYFSESDLSDVSGTASLGAIQNSSYYAEYIPSNSWTINSAETQESDSFTLPSNYYYQCLGIGSNNQYLYFSIGAATIGEINYTISLSDGSSYSHTVTGVSPGNSPVSSDEYFWMDAYANPSHPVYGTPTISITIDATSNEHFTNAFGDVQAASDSSSISS